MYKKVILSTIFSILFIALVYLAVDFNISLNIDAKKMPSESIDVFSAINILDDENTFEAKLYYRYANEYILAGESRTIKVKQGETNELALLKELLEGPDSVNINLSPLFDTDVKILSAVSINNSNLLAVTFSNAVLNKKFDNLSQIEASKLTDLRKLQLQSIVASITEAFNYSGIQFYIKQKSDDVENFRLNYDFIDPESNEVMPVLSRDETLLMTPSNSLDRIITALKSSNNESLMQYIDTDDMDISDAVNYAFEKSMVPENYSIGSGTLSENNTKAVCTLRVNNEKTSTTIPVKFHDYNGIWLADYNSIIFMFDILEN